MAAHSDTTRKSADGKLFWNGRSQAVRLPKEFRFEGERVRLTRSGAGVLMEPVEEKPKEAVEKWFARLDAMGADPLFPKGRKQKLAPVRKYFR